MKAANGFGQTPSKQPNQGPRTSRQMPEPLSIQFRPGVYALAVVFGLLLAFAVVFGR